MSVPTQHAPGGDGISKGGDDEGCGGVVEDGDGEEDAEEVVDGF